MLLIPPSPQLHTHLEKVAESDSSLKVCVKFPLSCGWKVWEGYILGPFSIMFCLVDLSAKHLVSLIYLWKISRRSRKVCGACESHFWEQRDESELWGQLTPFTSPVKANLPFLFSPLESHSRELGDLEVEGAQCPHVFNTWNDGHRKGCSLFTCVGRMVCRACILEVH